MANTQGQQPRQRKNYPSVQLLKEKVQCPTCQASMSLRQLRFRHICGKARAVDMESKKASMVERAIQAHMARMNRGEGKEKVNMVGGTSCDN